MKRTKVRFNLSRGKNYMKWKVDFPDGSVEYIDPSDVTLKMKACSLKNNHKTALEIFKGANKSVCAWILCDNIQITRISNENFDEQQGLRYNPKINPFWSFKGDNVDGKEFSCIESRGNKLYVIY